MRRPDANQGAGLGPSFLAGTVHARTPCIGFLWGHVASRGSCQMPVASSQKLCTREALQPIAPGRAKHAPGEWRVDCESAPRRGAKIRQSATPAGVGDSSSHPNPGLLRTPLSASTPPAYPGGTPLDFRCQHPAETHSNLDVTDIWNMAAGNLFRAHLDTAPFEKGNGVAISSSPCERLWNGDEDVATPFHAGAVSRCTHLFPKAVSKLVVRSGSGILGARERTSHWYHRRFRPVSPRRVFEAEVGFREDPVRRSLGRTADR